MYFKDVFGELTELTLDSFKVVRQKVKELLKGLLKTTELKKDKEQLSTTNG